MSDAYLPWWLGGALLGAVTIVHLAATGRLLSVSGLFARAMRWRDDEDSRHRELALESGELDDALLAATRARFGEDAAEMFEKSTDEENGGCRASATVRLPIAAGMTFLLALAAGGASSQLLAGGEAAAASGAWLGSEFTRFATTDLAAFCSLLGGGLLLGFGAQMAGGCTSGHGLSGIARFQPGSMMATACIFAGGILASLALEWL